ncbi:hypothetical protein QBC36DRAFT_391313 [Triangularia setosa]|uniref:DUF4962 domain-containing protein n=1 Tax=Triangularia setosa TaxID=2587417 RepID=A0AAN6VYK1_9PEZI|nr:hypothetical protein QBC36DRAFT_391313 [Podospora setosa]
MFVRDCDYPFRCGVGILRFNAAAKASFLDPANVKLSLSWHSPQRSRTTTKAVFVAAAALTISVTVLTFYLQSSLTSPATPTFHAKLSQPPVPATSTSKEIVVLGHRLNPTHPRLLPAMNSSQKWDNTIFQQAEEMLPLPHQPTNCSAMNKKTAYACRLTSHTKWKARIWEEIVHVAGNSTASLFGQMGDSWNSEHWFDVEEFLVAFGIAYDWLCDAWTPEEREGIMWKLERKEWFLGVKGNWNCVTVGGLAVIGYDPTGVAGRLLDKAVANVEGYCGRSIDGSGSWVETPDYWYFALLTSLRGSFQMLDSHPRFQDTGSSFMGDCGPAKITATANSLLFYGSEYGIPEYGVSRRGRPDAADPMSILWYDQSLKGEWHDQLPLDKAFSDPSGAWVSMRSFWADSDAIFVAMKGGKMTGHATHGNLDVDSYNAPGYFPSEHQNNVRWGYYRCGTSGQNTIIYNSSNQIVDAEPVVRFESSLATQGLGRRQVLLQDVITEAMETSQWRMHTKAQITYSNSGRTARKVPLP